MTETRPGPERAVAPIRPCTSGEATRTRTRLRGMGHQRRVSSAQGAHGRGLPVTAALRSFSRYQTHAWFRKTSHTYRSCRGGKKGGFPARELWAISLVLWLEMGLSSALLP